MIQAVRQENQELPAGALTTQESERLVKVQGRIATVQQFRDIIVARRGSSPVYLWQVANVVDGQQDEDNAAMVDGVRGLAIDVVQHLSDTGGRKRPLLSNADVMGHSVWSVENVNVLGEVAITRGQQDKLARSPADRTH